MSQTDNGPIRLLHVDDDAAFCRLVGSTLEPAADAGTVVTDVLPSVEGHGGWGGETVGERADGSTVEHDATVTETPDGELVVTAREFERNGEAG